MPSSDKQYGSGWNASEIFEDLECPSGTWCQVRKPNPRQLMALGFINKFDQLSGLVESKHIRRVKGKPEVNTESMSQDPKAIMDILDLADRVTEYVVVQPTVIRPVVILDQKDGQPIERPMRAEEREDGVIYTDMLDDLDKMYIFQYSVGGKEDLATFRKQLGEPVNLVGNGASVPRTPVRTTKGNPRR
jgi:hypothetical protein